MAYAESTSPQNNHILRTVDVQKSFVDPVEVEVLKLTGIDDNQFESVLLDFPLTWLQIGCDHKWVVTNCCNVICLERQYIAFA